MRTALRAAASLIHPAALPDDANMVLFCPTRQLIFRICELGLADRPVYCAWGCFRSFGFEEPKADPPHRQPYPALAFSPAAWMPATAQASSLSEVSPETPTAPSSVVPSMISTPPGTGTSAPFAIVFTASMK